MVNGTLTLDRLAGGRSNGLLPTVRTHFEEREAAAAFAAACASSPSAPTSRAPNPRGRSRDRLPENMVAFAPRTR